jgi:hypothetical protein
VKKSYFRILTTAGLACGLMLSIQTASASVEGALLLNGGSVTVSATSLTWNGFAIVNGGSTLTYGSGTLVPGGTDVTLKDLPGTLPTPIDMFMAFSGIPMLDFTLDVAGPGSTNTDCSVAGLASHGGECSAFAGVPIVLTQGVGGTVASLGVFGTASDGTSPDAVWFGEFSQTVTTLAGSSGVITPLEVQNFFGGPSSPNGATLTTTFSGTFTASIVPEPSTAAMSLLGTSLLLVALVARRKVS